MHRHWHLDMQCTNHCWDAVAKVVMLLAHNFALICNPILLNTAPYWYITKTCTTSHIMPQL